MKKLLMVLLVLLMAAPAIAADWNFYGSARVTTFYTIRDSNALGNNSDIDLDHRLQNNSRIGVNVKADKLSGKIELALRAAGANSGVTGDESVNTRLAYGDWNFADKSFVRVGKELSVLDMTDVSNQVYGSDNDLTGLAPSANRTSGVGLGIGGLRFNLVQPATNATWGAAGNTSTNDAKYPKFEGAYTLPLSDMFTFGVAGGFQNVQVANPTDGSTEDVNSFMAAAKVKSTIGAVYANLAAFYGQNMYNANWGTTGINQVAAYSAAGFNAGGDLKDATSYGVGGALGLKFSDSIEFEAGGGWRNDDNDLAATTNNYCWSVYGQMTFKLAPGFKITPEVGYFANPDNPTTGNSGGYDWYAGLQWRLDF